MILSKHSKTLELIRVNRFFLLISSDTPDILLAKCLPISFSRILSISILDIEEDFNFLSFFQENRILYYLH